MVCTNKCYKGKPFISLGCAVGGHNVQNSPTTLTLFAAETGMCTHCEPHPPSSQTRLYGYVWVVNKHMNSLMALNGR